MDETATQRSLVTQHIANEKQEMARQMRRTMTGAEASLWKHLRAGQLGGHFHRQQNIDSFIADFYCHSFALVVEVE